MPDSGPREFGLGRGLDALIPPPAGAEDGRQIPLDRIVANPHQPRARFEGDELADLASSISTHGVLQPVVVRGLPNGDYQLIAGERRVRAARIAGLTQIPAVVREPTEEQMVELALIENLQRADLNPLEEALGFRLLIERFGMPHEAVATRVGRSRAAVSNALRLLDLAPETQEALLEGKSARARSRPRRTHRARAPGCCTRHRARAQAVRPPDRGACPTQAARPAPTQWPSSRRTSRSWRAASVACSKRRWPSPGPDAGRISIEFASDEELDRLLTWILRNVPEREPPRSRSAAGDFE